MGCMVNDKAQHTQSCYFLGIRPSVRSRDSKSAQPITHSVRSDPETWVSYCREPWGEKNLVDSSSRTDKVAHLGECLPRMKEARV